MKIPQQVQSISVPTLIQWVQEKQPVILVSTLTADYFAQAHLPGARNACVFEVDFLEQVRGITTDKEAPIVLYGASETSMEAAVAAEKLNREGYARLHLLQGGLRAWKEAGQPLEGEQGQLPAATNRLILSDGDYAVDIDQSVIEWAGRNPNSKHDGSVRLSSGTLQIRDGEPTGQFEIDMTQIENRSLAGDELQPVLLDHLHSDDFFFTRIFPTATFIIQQARQRPQAHISAPNVDLQGELALRGVAARLDFPATVVQTPDGTITARSQFELDRTRWDIIYGSARFFENLGMHLVFDHISIDLKIVANQA